jgi:hypothetical protein
MSILSTILGEGISAPIKAIGNALDSVITSDEERLQAQAVLEKLAQHPAELQVELNKIEAQHKSIWVSGWRPYIGWSCGTGLLFAFLINPIIQWLTGHPGPVLPMETIHDLVLSMLGLGALRTYEKYKGVASK